ncbi:unnamed protein product [Caenorhabditis auriculariae]|uniref:Uncharacterized protein n=1 Tax=Caenorhabditis auriculariae TaxID=2777116 RepID=A0A8S1H0G2_9PELO|nr:unnamed protein product [Caenorhabditis auriculariae]
MLPKLDVSCIGGDSFRPRWRSNIRRRILSIYISLSVLFGPRQMFAFLFLLPLVTAQGRSFADTVFDVPADLLGGGSALTAAQAAPTNLAVQPPIVQPPPQLPAFEMPRLPAFDGFTQPPVTPAPFTFPTHAPFTLPTHAPFTLPTHPTFTFPTHPTIAPMTFPTPAPPVQQPFFVPPVQQQFFAPQQTQYYGYPSYFNQQQPQQVYSAPVYPQQQYGLYQPQLQLPQTQQYQPQPQPQPQSQPLPQPQPQPQSQPQLQTPEIQNIYNQQSIPAQSYQEKTQPEVPQVSNQVPVSQETSRISISPAKSPLALAAPKIAEETNQSAEVVPTASVEGQKTAANPSTHLAQTKVNVSATQVLEHATLEAEVDATVDRHLWFDATFDTTECRRNLTGIGARFQKKLPSYLKKSGKDSALAKLVEQRVIECDRKSTASHWDKVDQLLAKINLSKTEESECRAGLIQERISCFNVVKFACQFVDEAFLFKLIPARITIQEARQAEGGAEKCRKVVRTVKKRVEQEP